MNGVRSISRCFRKFLLCLLLTIFGAVTSSRAASDTLLDFGSYWTYWDFGYEPDPDWYGQYFDDGLWSFGAGQFGYGEGDESTVIGFGSDAQHKYVTTYFRTEVYVSNPGRYSILRFRMLCDPGAIVYVNGVQVFRVNMTDDDFDSTTLANTCLNAPAESSIVQMEVAANALTAGYNVIAVEMHTCAPAADDLSFDLQILGDVLNTSSVALSRGPYLQVGTSSNVFVRWRTTADSDTRVRFGVNPANLNWSVSDTTQTNEHEIALTNLAPYTRYYYDVGSSTQKLAGDSTYTFITAPVPGTVQPVRFWAIGDFGTGFSAQYQVRDAYANFTGSRYTDFWLMLGDNAYGSGLDTEYQAYLFNVYQTMLRQSVVWPTIGNHDAATDPLAGLSPNLPYYLNFTMPTNAQAGGLASGTEQYYSFDYANIHFVCLNSETPSQRNNANSPMLNWLRADLADTTRDWIIVFFHHPPYSHGSHNSDTDGDLIPVRTNIAPILDNAGVDLVLSGHSHSYERSYLINGYYVTNVPNATNFVSQTDGRTNGAGAYLKPAGGLGANRGTVYIVDGSSGGQNGFFSSAIPHYAMYHSTLDYGSLCVDINGLRLDATFVRSDGTTPDYFTLIKGVAMTNVVPQVSVRRAGTNAVLSWPTSIPDYQLVHRADTASGGPWTATPGAVVTNGRRKVMTLPANTGTNRFFRVRSVP